MTIVLLGCNSQVPTSIPFVRYGDTLGWSDSIYIHFQDGFYSDSLSVLMNKDVFTTITNLTTNPNWSLADGIVIPKQTTNSINIILHRTSGTYSLMLELPTENFIGISSVNDSGWVVETSKKPFLYE